MYFKKYLKKYWLAVLVLFIYFLLSPHSRTQVHTVCLNYFLVVRFLTTWPIFHLLGSLRLAVHRGWSPKFETGINIIIKSALYSIFWQDSITNIKINSFQIFWRLCNPFFWEYTKDLLGVYFGYNGGVFGLYLSYSGAILELYWGYLILGL